MYSFFRENTNANLMLCRFAANAVLNLSNCYRATIFNPSIEKADDTDYEEKMMWIHYWRLMHMFIKVVWFQWCGIKSGVNVFGMCSFFCEDFKR